MYSLQLENKKIFKNEIKDLLPYAVEYFNKNVRFDIFDSSYDKKESIISFKKLNKEKNLIFIKIFISILKIPNENKKILLEKVKNKQINDIFDIKKVLFSQKKTLNRLN